ncbi:MAG: PAS domain S-box protein [Desulfobacteraceae bacterium]|nr:MAG: PAS domain S-box protein [Desulfobacteraceae bacterium]
MLITGTISAIFPQVQRWPRISNEGLPGDKKMRTVIYLICFVLMISIAPAAAQKTIMVGGEIDYPPYCFLDKNGRPTGFQVDLTRSIAKVMGMEIEISLSLWAEVRKGLENGTIDIICGMFYSEERAEIYDFSPPYAIVSSVIFARRDAPSVHSIDELRNKEIIVMRGEAMHDFVVKQKITQKLILAETPHDVLKRLADGEGDYALGAQMPGLYWIDKLGLSNITTMGKPLEPFKDCFAVRKGNTLLLSRFSEGLMILQQTGEFQKLHQKWFGVLETPGVSLTKVLKYAAAVFLPLLVLMVAAFIWSWTLRHTVAHRTQELSDSRQQLYTLSDNLPNGYVYQIVADGEQRRFTYISAGVEKLHGISAKDVMADAMLLYGQIVEEDRHLMAEQEALTQESLARFYVEVRYRRPSGEIRWLLITSSPRRLPDQRIAAEGLAIDITDSKRAGEFLQESEKRFRLHFEDAPLPSQSLDANGNIIAVNKAWLKTLGYSIEDVLGQWFGKFLPADHQDIFRERFPRFKKMGEIFGAEFEMVAQDGSVKIVSFDGRIGLNPDGSFRQTYCVFKDLTTLRQTQDALREKEKDYRLLVENLSTGIVVHGSDTGILFSNPMASALLGLTEDQMRGKTAIDPAWSFLREDKTPMPLEEYPVNRVLSSGDPLLGQVLGIRRPDRPEPVWVLCNAYPMIDGAGNLFRVVVAFSDITERKRTEELLRESEERLAFVLEGSQLGYWDWNIETGDVKRNERWAEMLGYTLREIEFNVKQWTDLHHPDDREAAWKSIQDHLEGCTDVHKIEYRMRTKDGQYKWILDCARVVKRDAQGRPLRMSGTHTDITDRRQAEEERERLQAQLNHALKIESVGRLAGGVAHDFNNMLGIIIGHAEMAMEQVDPVQPLYDDLLEIRKAAERSAGLTRQLLAFARRQTVSPRVLDLNETVESMLKMLRRLIGEGIDLAWQPRAGVWQIKMDPTQIDQILANLCINARDAIADMGKITIETQNIVFDEDYCALHVDVVPGEYVLLAVSDDGGGMDKETLEKLFEPFYTTKEMGKGTGLGLATVYGIVKQNNGFINVYSEPGQGTTFKIYLPRYQGKAGQEKEKFQADPVAGGHETILLVEDEPAILKMTTTMLERMGYSVLAANTPGEAIRLAEAHPGEISLLMTDVVMPEMNGRDLAKNLLSFYPHLKRLFMSGYTANVIAHHGVLDEGMNFIQKPFSMKDLAAILRGVLDSK